MRLGIGLNITRQNEVFRLSNLFAGDTAGIYHNFSDLTSLYTDSAGATPLTLPDTTIGLVADRSRVRSPVTVAAGIQANAGLRPKWGRAPKVRRNLFVETEFRNGVTDAAVRAGLISATTLTGYAGALAFGRDGVTTTYAYKQLAVTTGVTYTMSAIVEMTDGLGPPVFSGTAASNDFALIMESNAQSAANHVTTALGGGLYRVSASKVSATTGTTNFGVVKNAAYSARTFKVTAYQMQVGALTAYQKVNTSFDMTEDGLPSYGFTRPDRSDDVLSTTIPADQTGDVAIFGRNGSWIENAKTYAAASTFSLGATTATGLASGVLAAVGDIVGVLAIGKALSDAEKQLALDYHEARGAAGWLTAGAEMLTNGDFASDTVWTKGTDWTIAAGVATKVAGVASVLAQAVAPTALVAYQLDFTVTRTAGTVTPRFTGGTTVSGAAVSASGTYRQLLVAASGNTAVDFSADTTFAGTIDNVSLKPLVAA